MKTATSITLLAAGSRGDTQPFVALGVALKDAGYSVRVAAAENFKSLVEAYGLEFHPIAGDVAKIAGDERLAADLKADTPLKAIMSFNKLRALASELPKDYVAACQGSDAVVYHPGAAVGYFAARALKVPSILASPFPLTPTRAYPSLIFYDAPRLGGRVNVLSHKLFEQVLWQTSKGAIKTFWQRAYGVAPEAFGNPLVKQRSASSPTIVSCSAYVFPKPSDLPEHVHLTGYWFLDAPGGWRAPPDLEAFLEGPPPVYVGFGSAADKAAHGATRSVIDALKETGQRGVLATGWGGLTRPADLPDHIYMLEEAPHAWLFPKMAAVIHHGGAGTTAAGLRAGVPTIVIPHALDQFAWGRRVHELGVGSRPIRRKRLSKERLVGALREALSEPVRRQARALGENIRTERGAQRAVQIITSALEG